MQAFEIISVLAIIAGGLVAAFSAKRPSRVASWASAYLVLVVGIIQLGLAVAWQALAGASSSLALAAFIIYNLGNASVLAGTIYKARLKRYSLVVNCGGALLALAMVLLLLAPNYAKFSWPLAAFVALAIIILVSMPIGLTISSRRHRTSKEKLP